MSGNPRTWCGPTFSADPNIGLLWSTLNPILRFRFSAAGQTVHRVYRAAIYTVGVRPCFSWRMQSVFVLRLPFRKLFKHERIELGRGFDIGWGLHITYVNFREHVGGILCIGVPVGISFGAAYVRGGWLIPMQHPENIPDLLSARIAAEKSTDTQQQK